MIPEASVKGWRRVKALYSLFIKDCFAYPAASFIWVIADAQSAVILPAVLLAAAGPGQLVGTMSQADLASYYLVSMTLAQFIVCHLMWDLAWEIREGTFTIYLVRPYSYFWTCLVRNFAWRSTKISLFMPIFVIAMLVYGPYAHGTTLHIGPDLFLVAILAQTLSFSAGYCLAMLTFWTTEFISAFRIYYIPEMFFSGRLLPISLMPAWTLALGNWLWFKYTISFPVQMVLGKLTQAEILEGITFQCGWIAVFAILGSFMFRRGLRIYSAVGM